MQTNNPSTQSTQRNTDVKYIKGEINKLCLVLEEHQAKVDALKADKEAVMGATFQIEGKLKELADINAVLLSKHAELKEAQVEKERTEAMNKNLLAEADKHGEKLIQLKDEHKQVSAVLLAKSQQLAGIEGDMVLKHEDHSSLLRASKKEQEKLDKMKEHIAKHEQSLKELKEMLDNGSQQVGAVEGNLLQKEKMLSSLESRIETAEIKLKNIVDSHKTKKAALEAELGAVLEEHNAQISKDTGDLSVLKSSLETKEAKLRGAKTALEKIHGKSIHINF